jgi:catechol 2,3-dioxygenase-like lactoylglutathione lyase family enzyme
MTSPKDPNHNSNTMNIRQISAITLAVRDMTTAVEFYEKLDMKISYGGRDSFFTTFRAGDSAINLILAPARQQDWWGRLIIRVDDVDKVHQHVKKAGLDPEEPRDAAWGERFFHVWDPDGHEISFAELLPSRKEP